MQLNGVQWGWRPAEVYPRKPEESNSGQRIAINAVFELVKNSYIICLLIHVWCLLVIGHSCGKVSSYLSLLLSRITVQERHQTLTQDIHM